MLYFILVQYAWRIPSRIKQQQHQHMYSYFLYVYTIVMFKHAETKHIHEEAVKIWGLDLRPWGLLVCDSLDVWESVWSCLET